MAVGGLENMYISSQAGELSEMGSISGLSQQLGGPDDATGSACDAIGELSLDSLARQWSLDDVVQVFSGDFTNPSDRIKLVEPVLGLWAMVVSGRETTYAMRTPRRVSSRRLASLATALMAAST